ncbi:MAG: DUF1653 domain-containing protein [Parcubacteria group bacterium]|nr:DUF1653 domain-containing protein [Parcubacteria group bacterium]
MEKPLYPTKEGALAAEGEIYHHYKGGVYRLLKRDVNHSETLEIGVLYEHLWPYNHGFWFRPQELFFGKNEQGEEGLN